jgi:hypothetical protein
MFRQEGATMFFIMLTVAALTATTVSKALWYIWMGE